MAKVRQYKVYFSGKSRDKRKYGSVFVYADNKNKAKIKGRKRIKANRIKTFDIIDVKFTKWIGE